MYSLTNRTRALIIGAVAVLVACDANRDAVGLTNLNSDIFRSYVAIGNSIVHGNFPPVVPYFAGEPLSYHWFADFHGAIASTAAGLDIIPVYFATSALFAAVLALVVWALAIRLTSDRRVASIATSVAAIAPLVSAEPSP